MGKIFGIDSPVVRFMTKVGEMMVFSVLWLICCLPIVTAGAATAALYRMMFNIHEDRDTRVVEFFRAFGSNFKKATALWMILLLAGFGLLCLFNLILAVENDLLWLVLLVVFCVAAFVVLASGVYLFPLTAYFENTLTGTLRTAAGMALGNLKTTIPVCAVLMLPLVLALVSLQLFVVTLFLWVILGPGALAYGQVCLLIPVFRQYAPEENSQEA